MDLEVHDNVALKSIGSRLALIDVLDLLGGDTKLIKDVIQHLSEPMVAHAVD
jgi:hypothetical protein